MNNYLCVNRSRDDRHIASRRVTAPNAIEALRLAAEQSRNTGLWTAYQEIVTKDIVETTSPAPRTYEFRDPSRA